MATWIRGQYWLLIQCNNTDVSILDALERLTGVGTVYGPIRGTGPHAKWKPLYSWRVVRSNDAKFLMQALHPLMSEKRQEQIEVAFEKVGVLL